MTRKLVGLFVVFSLVVPLAASGCGDDDGGNDNLAADSGTYADAAPGPDAAPWPDGTPPVDGAGATANCTEIGLCAQDCGFDFGCINGCKAEGCQTAVEVYDVLQQCVIDNCMMACASDPQGQECETCRNDYCSNEIADCEANTCP